MSLILSLRRSYLLVTVLWLTLQLTATSLAAGAAFSVAQYQEALGKCSLFWEAQRSGKLPPT